VVADIDAFRVWILHDTEDSLPPTKSLGVNLETQTNPSTHKQESGSPYCSDPNCPYCRELRETQELVRTGRPIPQTMKRPAWSGAD